MERRSFLLLSGVLVGMVAIPPSLYFVSPGIKKYAAKLIEKELSYLKLDKEGLNNYINDYFKNASNNVMANVKWKVLYYGRSNSNSSNNVNDLLRYYLLSTDFFLNQMNVEKTVKYLGIFDPYKSPVANPFSYILLPDNQQIT
ncbi:hypothetical protein [Pedobacter jejuensis]|uniref:Uncharacterized protein n=1 Tax=Pedobacter jejuensis TaxID=1268550 RepID=A0A3N0BU40_9SPHI|nr:hypothetical protein [Pedobacter jejuensis]RNL52581.1 hypothetical protein D7004_13625 [Pedobacter jejuensis]